MRLAYNFAIFLYGTLIKLAALFGNTKAKLWISGRKNLIKTYEEFFKNHTENQFIWFHVSSLGEFEQARPVIEYLKHHNKNIKILLTFFSPSGYEIRKNYSFADAIFYLPLDTQKNAKKIVEIVKPQIVCFAKYDFWFNLIDELHKQNIPIVVFSALFRENQYFFKFYGHWFLKQLKKVSLFFTQTQSNVELLNEYGIQARYAGDTRIDRVIQIVRENRNFPEIEKFISNRKVLIAGSSWQKDEEFVFDFLKVNKEVAIIIAPHDISEKRLSHIEKNCSEPVIRYSKLNENTLNSRILLIDCIGILAYIYKYATIVHIGNGFGKGIHNILEPVAHLKPTIFGPNFRKFNEAITLVNQQACFAFRKFEEYYSIINQLLTNKDFYEECQNKYKKFIETNIGATELIATNIKTIIKN